MMPAASTTGKSRRPLLQLTACVLWLPVLAPAASAQQQPPTTSLERLGSEAAAFRKSVPSFTCNESVSSEQWRGNKLKWQVKFLAVLRVRRADDGTLSEAFEVKSLDGKPISGDAKFDLPLFVEGGFSKSLPGYFAPDVQSCYVYTPSPGRIDFTSVTDFVQHPGCREHAGLQGFATFNDHGEVLHVERRIPPAVAYGGHTVPFAWVEFAPTTLNGQIYRLPVTMFSEEQRGRDTLRYIAHYTGCQIYTSTMKVLPGSTPVPLQ